MTHSTTRAALFATTTLVMGCNHPTSQPVETSSATGEGDDGPVTPSTGASQTGTSTGATESTAEDFGNAEDSSGGPETVVLFDV